MILGLCARGLLLDPPLKSIFFRNNSEILVKYKSSLQTCERLTPGIFCSLDKKHEPGSSDANESRSVWNPLVLISDQRRNTSVHLAFPLKRGKRSVWICRAAAVKEKRKKAPAHLSSWLRFRSWHTRVCAMQRHMEVKALELLKPTQQAKRWQ